VDNGENFAEPKLVGRGGNWEAGEETWEEWDEGGEARYELIAETPFDDTYWDLGYVDDVDSFRAEARYNTALDAQIDSFHNARDWLERQNGLFYYVTDGKQEMSNLPEENRNTAFFLSRPVYFIQEDGFVSEHSSTDRYADTHHGYFQPEGRITLYAAYSANAVDMQNYSWRFTQWQLSWQLMYMAVPLLAAVILLVVLLAGAGRRYGAEGTEVYFTALDKPWLDIGLAALVAYEATLCAGMYYAADSAWHYANWPWLVALSGIMAVLFTPPLLWWLTSFVKRCKAGKFWRHTLLYKLAHWMISGLVRLVRSCWAGLPTTLIVGAMGFGLFIAIGLCFAVGWETEPELGLLCAFIVSAAVTLGILWHTRRLRLVEHGAKEASVGNYEVAIDVKGGELGSIADSIQRISDGIGAAVTQRMKSERLKTELITNVSHDIRTPLTSIITYTDLLKSEGLASENAPGYLDILAQKAARLKTLTDDLFEAAKAASGSVEAHLEELDLSDFVRQAIGELDERVQTSGLDFRLNLPEHAAVLADGKLL
jgi:signal transduction histidine kinase